MSQRRLVEQHLGGIGVIGSYRAEHPKDAVSVAEQGPERSADREQNVRPGQVDREIRLRPIDVVESRYRPVGAIQSDSLCADPGKQLIHQALLEMAGRA